MSKYSVDETPEAYSRMVKATTPIVGGADCRKRLRAIPVKSENTQGPQVRSFFQKCLSLLCGGPDYHPVFIGVLLILASSILLLMLVSPEWFFAIKK
jgi:hypothetical protein